VVALLVASIGGHLTQLHQLRPRLDVGSVVWVTNESPQSRSLLEGEQVEWMPYVAPRDARTATRLLPRAWGLTGSPGVDLVISTGSAIAVPFLTMAAARRRPAFYIESATRVDGPSLTGRMLARVPGVQLRTQSPGWADERWKYVGSVFDGWTAVHQESREVRKLVISLGTMQRYQFRALVDRLMEIIPPTVEVLWQVGNTDVSDLQIEARTGVPSTEMRAAMQMADAVVAHAGVGAALSALEIGKCPVLVPRRASRNEHVDDHQQQIADRLGRAGLAVISDVETLTWDHVNEAAARKVLPRIDGPAIQLQCS